MTRITAEPLDGPAGSELVAELDADLERRYGEGEAVHTDAHEFVAPDGLFLVLRVDGRPQACGGYRRIDDTTAELKRMYVRPEVRGTGLARQLLAGLEEAAAAAGYEQLWLETGGSQPEAVALYESSGYGPIARFGQYAWAPDQRCYGKVLEPRRSSRTPLS
ncbi:MAG: GNAT family N-acetyltransferase [Nitriliruptorales bacterium]|nr:GNAT family N-acetyltransferase [Nitriliruptorales bacterium]